MHGLKHKFLILILSIFFIFNFSNLYCKKDEIESYNQNYTFPFDPIIAGDPSGDLQDFEEKLEIIRGKMRIPGMSAAIAKNGKIVWAKGFGYADVENKRAATPNTSYRLASLTKTFASTVIMQLVEEGMVDLDDPVSDYGIELESRGIIRVKHLLTHTSEGTPGTFYSYNGNRYAMLDQVISAVTGKSFGELLAEKIIVPLGLELTGPATLEPAYFQITGINKTRLLNNLTLGYTSDGTKRLNYLFHFNSAAGLISTVIEISKYSMAINNNIFLSEEIQNLVFSPAVSNAGLSLPYGLGWFIQNKFDVKIVWHYGYSTAVSSLIVKIPEQKLTFVILANNDMLSRGSPGIGSDNNVTRSVVAEEFLNAFVFGDAELPDTAVDFSK